MLKNIGSNWALTLTGIAVTYVLTPFVIHALGREGYGVWIIVTSLTGHMGLLALGVPMASIRYLAKYLTEGDKQKADEAIGTCAVLYLSIGLVALIVGAGLLVPFLRYDIPPAMREEATFAFAIMVLNVSLSFIGLLPEGILFAHHDFVSRNVVRIVGVLLRLGLTLLLLGLDASLVLLASVQVTCLLFDFCVSWIVIRRRYPDVRVRFSSFSRSMWGRIFSFSIYVMLLHAGFRLTFETDALVIGALMGVGAIPYYAVANSLIVYFMEFVIAISAVVSPMATKLHTEGKMDELREMFLRWSKVALSLTLAAGIFLFVFGPRFIGWWIDPSYEEPSGRVLQILMASSLIFLPIRGIALPVLMGIGRPRTATIMFLATGFVNVVLSAWLVKPLGLIGVALGTAIPNAVFAIMLLVVACRELGVPPHKYVEYVVPRATVGALPALALLLWFKLGIGVESIMGLVAAGSTMMFVLGVTWIAYVYRHDPYIDLKPHLMWLRLKHRT